MRRDKEPVTSGEGTAMTMRVVATDTPSAHVDLERRLFAAAGVKFDVAGPEDLARQVVDADAILTCFRRVDSDVLDAAVRCRTVARYGVGVDNIDVTHATRRGIVVTNVPEYCSDEVADHALLLLLALARRLPRIQRAIHAGGWPGAADALAVRLAGRTLGVVGMGTIGLGVAARAQSLGMRVVTVARGHAPLPGIEEMADLDALLAASDAVTLHAPLVAGTRGLIGARELARMKPGALLINTSRGGLVDTAALLAALEEGHLGGAGLDVTDPEPLPADHPLRHRDDVVLTSHVAFASDGSLDELIEKAVTNVLAVLQDRAPVSIVNPDALAPGENDPTMTGDTADDTEIVVRHLRARGLLQPTVPVAVEPLNGGVSNDVFAVSAQEFDVVVKRALHRLRVAETWVADPARIETEARALAIAAELAPGSAPGVVDFAEGLLVIERAPRSWRTWKDELLAGQVDVGVADRLGRVLGRWQRLSAARPGVLRDFDDRTAFEQLRVDPFHRTVAARHPDLFRAIERVVQVMRTDRRSLVHGDYSPKNVLVGPAGSTPWVIDWEVAHTGDPTFDPSWILGHLLLKTIRDPARAGALRAAATAFLNGRAEEAGRELPIDPAQLAGQVGCLVLARVDGKSPVNYLDEAGCVAARRIGASLLTGPPNTITDTWELL